MQSHKGEAWATRNHPTATSNSNKLSINRSIISNILQMKASFTDATLHKPVHWPQRKRRGAHGSKRYLKGNCMNQYHQTNKEKETSAMIASSCYTLSRKLTDGKWWWRGNPSIIERKSKNLTGPRISLQLQEYHEGTARCRTRPRRSKNLESTEKRGPRPESADRNGQLLQEEAIADWGLLTRVRSRRVGNMLQHLQGLWRPCANAFSHHGHELDPLRRARLSGVQVEFFVLSISSDYSPSVPTRLSQGLLSLWCRNGEI